MFEIAIFLLILLIAGLVQGTSGFGFGLVAVTFLSFVMNIKDASVSLVLVSLSINVFIFWKLRRSFRFERVMPLLISSLAGVPLGVLILIKADENMLKRILGIILIVAVIQGLLPKLRHKRWHAWWLGIPCGLFSGALSGAFATGGPPIVAFMSSQNFQRLRYVASVQLVLGTAAVIRLLCLVANSSLNSKAFSLSLVGAIAAVTGAFLGLQILKKINQELFRKIILAILTIMAFINIFQ
ncbi:MAG: sulfite exporter TauE/SafE family protein [Victivallaceae bacterium]|nr:sulfite exporter TauE/SafE family protein [Victivallaceae bacterium]